MDSQALVTSFMDHLHGLDEPDALLGADHIVILFGHDEFQYDPQRGCVWLDDIGWVSCEGLCDSDLETAAWVGAVRADDGLMLIVGYDDPYAGPAPDALPTKNGVLLAVPNAARRVLGSDDIEPEGRAH